MKMMVNVAGTVRARVDTGLSTLTINRSSIRKGSDMSSPYINSAKLKASRESQKSIEISLFKLSANKIIEEDDL